jgi:uncharacterized membrane protein YbhN (UPF0104 family)
MSTVLRLLAAIVLLALAIWLTGPARLRDALAHVEPAWFAAAVGSALAAQFASVLRWRQIARIFGLRAPLPRLAVAYAQGMTVNVLLPGATLGGDALRSLRLQRVGNPFAVSALTVLLDRLSGLWVLCVLSLLTAPALLLAMPAGSFGRDLPAALPAALVDSAPWIYLAGLALACALPFLPLRVPMGSGHLILARLAELHALALAQRVPLARSLWSSVVVQAFTAMTLWFCLLAAGGSAGYWQVQAVAAPVFVAGALPISYGGFGAREIAALLAFPLVGVAAGQGVAASALYGMVAIVLGLAAAPAFAWKGN